MAVVAKCKGEAARRSQPAATAWLFGTDLTERGIFTHHPDGDIRNGSGAWSTVADVAKPRAWCFLRSDESEVESNGGCGKAPTRCVIVVATARLSARGPVPVIFTPSGGV
jgi:hypothetical protein